MMNNKEKITYISILATHSIAFLVITTLLGIIITNVFILALSILILFPITIISITRFSSHYLSDYISRFWEEKEQQG